MSNEAEAAAPPKGKKSMLIWIILAVVAIGIGGALPWVLNAHMKDAHPQPKEDKETKKRRAALPFDDVVVNIGEPKLNRFLRVKLMIAVEEHDHHEVGELLTKQKAFLKSWLICYLSDLSAQEVTRRASVNRIRREICEQFNQMLWPNEEPKIVDILFDMFVVQQ